MGAFLVELQREPLTKIERAIKRVLDIGLASAIILALSFLMMVVAVAIKIDSPGPVIFRQRRNGFNGRQFVIYKFRTMSVIEDGEVICQAKKRDVRVTTIGRLLRRSSIDELPQLFNVLKGICHWSGHVPMQSHITTSTEHRLLITHTVITSSRELQGGHRSMGFAGRRHESNR